MFIIIQKIIKKMKTTIKKLIFLSTPFITLTQANALEIYNQNDYKINLSSEITAGYYDDQSIYRNNGNGLEAQPFKLTNATFSFKLQKSNIYIFIEPVLFSDEPKLDNEEGIDHPYYSDYFKNYGTDIIFYDEMPIREGYIGWKNSNHEVKIGRQFSFYSTEYNLDSFYKTRLDSPHQYFIDTELLSGVRYSYSRGIFQWDVGVLSGRGRPVHDFQFNDDSGPNVKNNNTPILETKLTLGNDVAYLYTGYRKNKVGSAPGRHYTKGKHNDNRFVYGLVYDKTFNNSFNFGLYAQKSLYEVGVTADGQQGATTDDLSNNIDKDGFVGTLKIGYNGFYSTYTYEKLNYDSAFYQYLRLSKEEFLGNGEIQKANNISDYLENNEYEENHIFKLGYTFKNGLDVSAFYKDAPDTLISYSNINFEKHNAEKYGLIFNYKLK